MSNRRGGKMPLLDHLREFRARLIKSSLAVVSGGTIGWFLYQPIIRLLTLPFCDLGSSSSPTTGQCGDLYVNGILGPFNLHVKIALLSGIIFAAPIWIYQLWAFITPALHKKERRVTLAFAAVATPLFASGSYLAYLILPHAVDVLLGFTPNNLGNLVRFDEYLDFVLRLILIFGIAFILPLFLVAFKFTWSRIRSSDTQALACSSISLLSFYRNIYSNSRPNNHDLISNPTLLALLC